MQGLNAQLDNKQKEIESKDMELEQYQKTVMRQTRELESAQGQLEIIDQQKQKLQNYDEAMQRQAVEI